MSAATAPSMPSLRAGAADCVHVWRARLDAAGPRRAQLRELLSAAERARVAQFRRPGDGRRFAAARGILRSILAGYLRTEPGRVELRDGPDGKPALCGVWSASGLEFSVSHSGGLALYAAAKERPVGIDLERIRPGLPVMAIARRLFPPSEVEALAGLAGDAREAAFFALWTRAEAVGKATGKGLLRRPGGDDRWSVVELDAGPGHAAALAVEGRGWQLRRWEWPADQRP